MMDERSLVAQVIQGDERAFEQIYQAMKPRLLKAAAHFLGTYILDSLAF